MWGDTDVLHDHSCLRTRIICTRLAGREAVALDRAKSQKPARYLQTHHETMEATCPQISSHKVGRSSK